MTAEEYLWCVCKPNRDGILARPDDYREAVNAVLTLDAFYGFLLADEVPIEGKTFKKDSEIRDWVADQSRAYHILRDCAFSLKHGNLDSKSRLVRRKQDIRSAETIWNDDGLFDDELVLSDELILADLDKETLAEIGLAFENPSIRIDVIVREVFRICECFALGRNTDHPSLEALLLVGKAS